MCEVIGIKDKSTVVDYLETLLQHARNGEIIGFAAVAVNSDASIAEGYVGIDEDVLVTIAGLDILKRRITSSYVEIPEEQ